MQGKNNRDGVCPCTPERRRLLVIRWLPVLSTTSAASLLGCWMS